MSEYLYRKRRYQSGERNPHLANLNKSFEDWVFSTFLYDEFRSRSFFERTRVHFSPANMIGDTLIWFIPQKRWLSGKDGTFLATEILRFENLEAEWSAFTARHGFDTHLQRKNISRTKLVGREEYSPETRKIVYEYYREDFEQFGYPQSII